MDIYPDFKHVGFEESVKSFAAFIGENGYPPRVVWVRLQDVLVAPRRTVYIREPLPFGNEQHARELFARGMRRELGVLFATLCEMGDVTCCYAWLPADADEAQRSLMPRPKDVREDWRRPLAR